MPASTSFIITKRFTLPSIAATRRIALRFSSSSSSSQSESIREQSKALAALIGRGRLCDAESLFFSSPYRTLVTWNSMLHGYVLHRHLALAQNLFDQMPQRDLVSRNTLLLGYASSGDPAELRHARKLFDEMRHRDSVSWNTMIRGYARNGRMADASALFDAMPERNAVSWNTMITGFLESGNVREALVMFDRMPGRDPASLCAVVAGLVRNGRLEDAEWVLMDWCTRIGETDGIIVALNTLITGYGHSGEVEKARRIFDMIPERPLRNEAGGCGGSASGGACKNEITWNSMMMCYIKAGVVCEARRLFDRMPKRDSISWNTMINGYVHALDMQQAALLFEKMRNPDEWTWSSMISGYSRMGDVEQACAYFDRMPSRNVISWNTMIAGYEQNADYEAAIRLFNEMRGVGERSNRHTLSSVLGACASLASMSLGSQVHQLVTKTFICDVPMSNSLITMYACCGDLIGARSIFDEMMSKKDFITWNTMIRGYAQHGLAAVALDLFERMKREKVKPTHITFVSVLSACCRAGLIAEGQRHFESMVREFGIIPSVEHYALLVNLLGQRGKLEEAMRVIENMLIQPDKSVWGAFLDACKFHENSQLAQIAANALIRLDPDGAGPYVLLYNMYVDMGRREEAIELREILDKNGIRKLPGYSWIELQGSVHNFVAGDRTHSLSPEIYSLIETYEMVARDKYQWDDLLDDLTRAYCT